MPPALRPCKSNPRRRTSSRHNPASLKRFSSFPRARFGVLAGTRHNWSVATIGVCATAACNPWRASHGPMSRRPEARRPSEMAKEFGFRTSTLPGGMAAILILATPALALSLAAQQQGPLPAPPVTAAAQPAPSAQPAVAAAAPAPATKPQSETSAITHEPTSITVEQIVQKFGDRELEFKKERDNYTYTQTFVVQTIDMDGRPDGEYRMTSDILFTPDGKRYEKVISAPPPTLERIQLSQQDMDDLEHVQPFVLTSQELPKYDVKYIGREQ